MSVFRVNKDVSWTEAAFRVLEDSNEMWLTAPEVIREIQRTQVKRIHCSFGQARRSVRSALIFHSRKENGQVVRHEGETRITYALRKRLRATHSLPATPLEETHLLNGSAESPPPPPPPSPGPMPQSRLPSPHPSAFTVEIDLAPGKVARGQRGLAGFCLPSPLHSILGPKRTLHVLQESVVGNSSLRPVRKVRKKSISKPEEEPSSQAAPPPSPLPPLPSFLGLEEHSSVPALLAEVSFLRTEQEGDPSAVQGARERVAHQEISLGPPVRSDSSSSEEEEEEESEEGSEGTESEPGQRVLVGRSPLTQLMSASSSPRAATVLDRIQQASLLPPPSPPPAKPRPLEPPKMSKPRPPGELRRSELLFTPTSPLATDNIKTLMNQAALEGLSRSQAQALVSLLPPADQFDRARVSESCFTNTFFSTAVREWQEQLAVGAFTSEYRSRARQEERRKSSLRTDDLWKQRYYEEYWGDRSEEKQDSPPSPRVHYPVAELPPLLQGCLQAVKEGYGRTDPPKPPSPPPPSTIAPVAPPPKKYHPKLSPRVASKAPTRAPTVGKDLKKPASKPALKAVRKPNMGRKVTVKRIIQVNRPLMTDLSCYLSPVTARLPHHALMVGLAQACRTPRPSRHSARPYAPPPPHSHPVFQDHFCLLSAEHVPEEFCGPVKSLPVRLPRELFSRCLQSKAVGRDHDYAGSPPFRHKHSLKLSVPRALLPSVCVCDGEPLLQCSSCHSLYHASCSRLCPTCSLL